MRRAFTCAMVIAFLAWFALSVPVFAGGSVNETWINVWNRGTGAWQQVTRGGLMPALKFSWDSSTSTLRTTSGVGIKAAGVNDSKMYWCDDFMEAANVLASTVYSKLFWTGSSDTGTQTVTAGVNGTMVLTTTAASTKTSSITFTTANFSTNNAPITEALVKLSPITTAGLIVGFYDGAGNDYAYFNFDADTDAANIYVIHRKGGGTASSADTGVDIVAGTNYKYRIEIGADESYKAYIDDVLVRSTPASTLTALTTLKPYVKVDNSTSSNAVVATADYVKVWQNR